MRKEIGEAAVRAAKAVGYVGAGLYFANTFLTELNVFDVANHLRQS